MKDFRLFDFADFVMDEDFIRWVHEGEKADNLFWENWLKQNPGKYMLVAEARRLLESLGNEQNVIGDQEKAFEVDRLLNAINNRQQEPAVPTPIVAFFKKRWMAVAASLLIVVASAVTYFLVGNVPPQEKFQYAAITSSKRLVEYINTSEKPVVLNLPDGSTIELQPDSRISYANNFANRETRDVYLSGEAFFTVFRNPGRPFRVFANEIVTKVLGTSFGVRCFERDSIIRVAVRTGKVSIYSQANGTEREMAAPNRLGGIILTPNQEIVYQKVKKEFQKALLENPVMLKAEGTGDNMLYEDVSLVKVFTQFSKIYGINIVYDCELLKNCTVTADLRNETFYRQLELICKAVGGRYEIIDGQVVIQAKGCGQ